MKEKIRELRQKRANLIQNARGVVDRAEGEKRSMSAEEETTWNSYMADIDKVDTQIEREERMAALEDSLTGATNEPLGQSGEPKGPEQRDNTHPTNTEEYRSAFAKRLMDGNLANLTVEEARALAVSSANSGANIVAPQQWVAQLIKDLDNAVFMRKIANVLPALTTSDSLGAPTLDADVDDADWTTELQTGNEGSMDFGKRELKPNPVAKRIKVSNKLVKFSSIPIEQLVRQRLAYKFGITEEKAFMRGDGVGKPLGLFTASDNGIDASRDIVEGNTATEVTYDGLIAAKFALKGAHVQNANWIFHRDVVKQIMKIKDNENRYILDPISAVADKILDRPYYMSEYAPNVLTAGNYAGIIGDFDYYWIVDALNMEIQRLVELYAETNQIGFIGRKETDGAPVLKTAFARIKLGA